MADETTTQTETQATETTTTTAPVTDWRAALTGDYAPLATEKSLESFKGQDWNEVGPHLAKAFVETKRMVGAKTDGMVRVPDDKSSPEEVAAFNKARGVPDSPEGYTIKRPELALTLGWDENAEKGFVGAAHKAGFTPMQAQTVIDYYGQMEQARFEADREKERAAGAELRKEWGTDFDAHMGRANRALSQYGGDELVEFLHTSKLGAHPLMVKAWAKVADDLAESGFIKTQGLPGATTPDEARAKVAEIDAQLAKLDPNSERASDLVNEKVRYLNAAMRAA